MRTARTLIASLSSTRGLHRHLPCCSLAARHGIYVYRSIMDYSSWIPRALLTCTACTFSVSQRWSISSLTVHLICTAYTVISFHSSTMEYTYYLEYGNYIVFVYYSCSSSSRRGFALWASAVDAHLFFPFPTERYRTVCHSPVCTVMDGNPCVDPTPSQVMDGTPFPEDRRRKEH